MHVCVCVWGGDQLCQWAEVGYIILDQHEFEYRVLYDGTT